MMAHPFQSTVDLLRALVSRLPPRFPQELGRCMRQRVEELALDASVTRDELDRVAAEFGKYAWHYRRAWEEVYEREGYALEEAAFLEGLSRALHEQVQTDSRSAGRPVRDIVRLPSFEQYTPEDRLLLEEALLAARQRTAGTLAQQLHDGEIPDYDRIALRWKGERLKIEAELLKLRDLARATPELADEIAAIVQNYEIGFSGSMGREPTLEEVQGKVRDYANRSSV